MIRWIKGKIKHCNEKIRLHRKAKKMDYFWYLAGGSCFGLFPPSFYYKHTEEEIKKLEREELAKLRKIIKDMKIRNEKISQ